LHAQRKPAAEAMSFGNTTPSMAASVYRRCHLRMSAAVVCRGADFGARLRFGWGEIALMRRFRLALMEHVGNHVDLAREPALWLGEIALMEQETALMCWAL